MLSALVRVDRGAGHYIPDFVTPAPPRFENQPAEELHAVATTPTWRVAGELSLAAVGNLANTVGRALPRQLTDADEQKTAEQLARELEQVWLHVLAPRWSRIRARMEADIADRLQTVGRHGFAAAIDSLDPQIDWHDGAVRVHGRFDVDVCEPGITFAPSVFVTRAATVIDPVPPCDIPGYAAYGPGNPAPWPYPERRAAMCVYPVARRPLGRTAGGGAAGRAHRPDPRPDPGRRGGPGDDRRGGGPIAAEPVNGVVPPADPAPGRAGAADSGRSQCSVSVHTSCRITGGGPDKRAAGGARGWFVLVGRWRPDRWSDPRRSSRRPRRPAYRVSPPDRAAARRSGCTPRAARRSS